MGYQICISSGKLRQNYPDRVTSPPEAGFMPPSGFGVPTTSGDGFLAPGTSAKPLELAIGD